MQPRASPEPAGGDYPKHAGGQWPTLFFASQAYPAPGDQPERPQNRPDDLHLAALKNLGFGFAYLLTCDELIRMLTKVEGG